MASMGSHMSIQVRTLSKPFIKHITFVSPVWVLKCEVKMPLDVNIVSQTSHLNGFSPAVWVLICFL